jgi:hypothetical protein
MEKLTLKKLAQYWKSVMGGDKILPNTPDHSIMTPQQAEELGDDILDLYERLEKLESLLLERSK